MKSGDSSGSDLSPQGYNEEDSSSIHTDDDNGTHPYGVGEEEEEAELWRQMAFAQESSKVLVTSCTLTNSFYVHFLAFTAVFCLPIVIGNSGESTRKRSQTSRRL